ncbi:hypothetical protein EBR37_01535 [bacterium]|nr:hypothetical protein [bacterium]
MGGLKINKNGFSTVELILVLIVVGLIGLSAWLVYSKNNQSVSKVKYSEFVNSIQSDGKVVQVSPDKIASSQDQIKVLQALHDSCSGSDKYVTVSKNVFNDAHGYIQAGDKFVEINANTCNSKLTSPEDGASANYLHKNNNGNWVLDAQSQQSPECSKVDYLGYPSVIIPTCYDGTTSRAPSI